MWRTLILLAGKVYFRTYTLSLWNSYSEYFTLHTYIHSAGGRVHVLERIADKVPVSNKYIAFAAFPSSKPHLR